MKKSSIFSLACFFVGMLTVNASNDIESETIFRIGAAVAALGFLTLVVKQIMVASDSKARIRAFGKSNLDRAFYLAIFAITDFFFSILIIAAFGLAPKYNPAVSLDAFSFGSMAIAAIMFFGIKFLGIAARKQRIENEKLAVA